MFSSDSSPKKTPTPAFAPACPFAGHAPSVHMVISALFVEDVVVVADATSSTCRFAVVRFVAGLVVVALVDSVVVFVVLVVADVGADDDLVGDERVFIDRKSEDPSKGGANVTEEAVTDGSEVEVTGGGSTK